MRSFSKHFLVCGAALSVLVASPFQTAHADSIKMLPPDNCSTLTGDGNYGIIGWDNTNPLRCVGGVSLTNAGNMTLGGYVKIGNTSATCSTAIAGALRFTGAHFEGCNGTDWVRLDAGVLASGTASGTFTIAQKGVLVASFNVDHGGNSDSPLGGAIKIDGVACGDVGAVGEDGHGLGTIGMTMTCVKLLTAGAHAIQVSANTWTTLGSGTWVVYPQ